MITLPEERAVPPRPIPRFNSFKLSISFAISAWAGTATNRRSATHF